MERGELPTGRVVVGGMDVPLMIAGDPAYPLLPWLIKGYTGTARLTPSQAHFNHRLGHARVVVEHAFGRFKGRWRRILKRSEISYKFVPAMVFACAILHNIVEERGDGFRAGWLDAVADDAARQPDDGSHVTAIGAEGRQAQGMRDHIADRLWEIRAAQH